MSESKPKIKESYIYTGVYLPPDLRDKLRYLQFRKKKRNLSELLRELIEKAVETEMKEVCS
ncbi:MAG: hypothetical protein QW794_07765 [Thermosphaera sp.]|uniref:hypothetical protein n=1 Tax=Thermofilum sp. TaxID=1961369 RepID=UPI003161AD74